MSIADGMKSIAENIVASHDSRIKAAADRVKIVGDLLGDARETIKAFVSERKAMGAAQAKDLAKFAHDLSKNIESLLKGFQNDRKQMGEEQAKNLAEFMNNLVKETGNLRKDAQNSVKQMSKDRSKMSAELKDKLAKDASDLAFYVTKKLKEFNEQRSQMSDELKKSLAKFVHGIQKTVKDILGDADKLIGEYHSDMQKAKAAWKSMETALVKGRKKGMPVNIEAGEETTTVDETAGKSKKTGKRKKK